MLAEELEAEAAHLREGWAMEMTAQRLESLAAKVRALEAREQARLSARVPGFNPETTDNSSYGARSVYGGTIYPVHIADPECEEPR